jgi:hypothetical protein
MLDGGERAIISRLPASKRADNLNGRKLTNDFRDLGVGNA